MLQKGAAKKVTIYVNEDTQHHFGSLTDAIMTFLLHKGVAGATATRAISGFGGHRVMHTTKIEVQDTQVVKIANKERPKPPKTPHTELKGSARLMRIYMGESDKWQGEPLHEAVLKRLRLMDVAGATVYRGILGYGAKGHTHKSGRLFSHDLPVMISVVDTEEKLKQAIDAVESMMQDGIIVLSDVDVIRLVHSTPSAEASNANH